MNNFPNWHRNILLPSQRQTHTYVIGQPGTGKSRLLESWIMQDIRSGKGVCVIDPHGDLFRNVLGRTAYLPHVWSKVVVIDPCNTEWVVNINPLLTFPGISSERIAAFVSDIILKIWKINSFEAPRMSWLMINSFIAVSELGLTLLDLPRFLLDQGYRGRMLPGIKNQNTSFYFSHEYPSTLSGANQWAAPLLNKLGGLLFDQDIRYFLLKGEALNFRRMIDERNILLVNISKGILGENTSSLLGAFIVAQIQKAALSRADQTHRSSFYLYLDEFQNYTSDNIKDILSESRKYSLSLILAHQYLDQLSPDIRSAILNTAGAITAFRVGYDDAHILSRVIFPSSDFLKKPVINNPLPLKMTFSNLTAIAKQKGLGWEGETQKLTTLKNREFWMNVRKEGKPLHFHTYTMEDLPTTLEFKNLVKSLVATSGRNYGRLKSSLVIPDSMEGLDPTVSSMQNDLPMWEV